MTNVPLIMLSGGSGSDQTVEIEGPGECELSYVEPMQEETGKKTSKRTDYFSERDWSNHSKIELFRVFFQCS